MPICGIGINELHHVPVPVVALTIEPSMVKAGEGKEMVMTEFMTFWQILGSLAKLILEGTKVKLGI